MLTFRVLLPQRWQRPYQSGLIIQTFAVYLSAIKYVPWLLGMFPNSEDPSTAHPVPRPALALAAAAMERALTLVANGKITIASIEADKTRKGKLIQADLNPITGKRSISTIAFSEGLWGTEVGEYCANIKGLRNSDMDAIIFAARKYSRATGPQDDDDDDEFSRLPLPHKERNGRTHIPFNYDADADEDDDEDEDAHGEVNDDQKGNGEEEDDDDEGGDGDDEERDGDDEDGHAKNAPLDRWEDSDLDLQENQHDAHPVEDYEMEEDEYPFVDGHALDSMDEVCVSPLFY